MITFAGVDFKGLNLEDILNSNNELKFITTLNSEFIVKANQDHNFKKILDSSISTFDGQIPFWLAKFKTKRKDFIKISGSTLIYDTCHFAQLRNEKIFLLGGKIESNQLAVQKLKIQFPGLSVEGYSPEFSNYPFADSLSKDISTRILDYQPQYLFVGFGAGKQESWIYDNLEFLKKNKVRVVVGSGGTFEFVSGVIERAPLIIQNIGLEGVYRFLVEPKFFRFKRLLISFKVFLYFYK